MKKELVEGIATGNKAVGVITLDNGINVTIILTRAGQTLPPSNGDEVYLKTQVSVEVGKDNCIPQELQYGNRASLGQEALFYYWGGKDEKTYPTRRINGSMMCGTSWRKLAEASLDMLSGEIEVLNAEIAKRKQALCDAEK